MKKNYLRIIASISFVFLFISYGYCESILAATKELNAPTGIKVTNSNWNITISWNAVKNSSNYNVYQKEGKYGKYNQLTTLKETSYILKDFEANKDYYFVVKAVSETNGQSVCSKEVKIKIGQIPQFVSIIDKSSYYKVDFDLEHCNNHKLIGKQYGALIVKNLKNYNALLDSYIAEFTTNPQKPTDISFYQELLERTKKIKSQVPQEYQDEIDGIAENLADAQADSRGDGKISRNELELFNLLPDTLRSSQCSALSIYGPLSKTGKTMTARLLDWPGGSKLQMNQFHAFITFKNKSKSICLVSYLGYMGAVTGFNNDRVFAAMLDSSTGMTYTADSKRSYGMDLRYALENKTSIDEVSNYMKSPDRNYTYNHLIFLADPSTSKILENNFSSSIDTMQRALRTSDSQLNPRIEWGFKNAVAAVNSFILSGNHDNHTWKQTNTARWESIKSQLASKGDIVTLSELKEIASYNGGDDPGSMVDGDIYNRSTQQIVIFEPAKLFLEVFFAPKVGPLPNCPKFEKIPVSWTK